MFTNKPLGLFLCGFRTEIETYYLLGGSQIYCVVEIVIVQFRVHRGGGRAGRGGGGPGGGKELCFIIVRGRGEGARDQWGGIDRFQPDFTNLQQVVEVDGSVFVDVASQERLGILTMPVLQKDQEVVRARSETDSRTDRAVGPGAFEGVDAEAKSAPGSVANSRKQNDSGNKKISAPQK